MESLLSLLQANPVSTANLELTPEEVLVDTMACWGAPVRRDDPAGWEKIERADPTRAEPAMRPNPKRRPVETIILIETGETQEIRDRPRREEEKEKEGGTSDWQLFTSIFTSSYKGHFSSDSRRAMPHRLFTVVVSCYQRVLFGLWACAAR